MNALVNNTEYKELKVSNIRQETHDFITIELTPTDNENIFYQPGQYLTLLHTFRGEEIRRSYSLTSSPLLNEPLTIGVKRIQNGTFSRYLHDALQPGDTLSTTGAAGLFVLPHNLQSYNTLFLLAAGSGITPLYSILKTVLYGYNHVNIVLIYSNHSRQTTPFLSSLRHYETVFKDRLSVHYLYSNNKDIYYAHLHRDLLISLVRQHTVTSYNNVLAYVCGPLSYRRMCMYTLPEAGIPETNIRKETFDTTAPPVLPVPPDTQSRWVHIYRGGSAHSIQVHYPFSILKTARQDGMALPYSCETGKCGNCTMRCTRGEVWMAYNEVLTPKDLAEGLVLTCTGHPVNGDVELHAL